MPSLFDRILGAVSPARRDEQRNIRALAGQLDASYEDAAIVYRRSREIGFGAAMLEHEQRCRERDARSG